MGMLASESTVGTRSWSGKTPIHIILSNWIVKVLSATVLCKLLLVIMFLRLSFGVDTLLPNQMISVGQILISCNQHFEMGFFSPGRSPNRYLGIWYMNTPDVVIWVANRNNLISDSHGVTFSISGNGCLVINRNGSIVWSANPSEAASNPILQLLDNGNLVLLNKTMKQGSSQRYLWQSFDYPTNTLLPEMKLVDDIDAGVVKYLTSWRNWDDPSPGDFVARIENLGMPGVAFYRGKRKIFRMGTWNGRHFCGYSRFPNPIFKPQVVFRGERLISVSIDPLDRSILKRATLDTSGIIYSYTMNTRKDKWNLVDTTPADQCDDYGLCGPNGICSTDTPSLCHCLKGFAPKFQKEWDLQDWSSGCTRITPLNCKSGDGFQEVRGLQCICKFICNQWRQWLHYVVC